MEINQERLWRRLHELAKIGKDANGGWSRLAYTREDMLAKDWLVKEMKEAGLAVHEDAVGNVIGVMNPDQGEQPWVVSGSHFDTVRNGGMFDGCLGVLAALEAAQTLIENHVSTKRPVAVIGYRDEEGNRFSSGMIGSKVATGKAEDSDFLALDEAGISLKEAMRQCGYHPEDYRKARLNKIYAAAELHIEQGKVLENNGYGVGIVEGIPYLRFYEITIRGCSGHAGATPMNDRQDPVVAMSRWIEHITRTANQIPHTVATIGRIQAFPGSVNVIADRVVFSLDIRSLKEANINLCLHRMKSLEKQLCDQGFTITKELRHILYGNSCDERLKDQLEAIMKERNLPVFRLMSGAGHDSQNYKDVCPCAMIFVRSQNGYSHRKEEFSSKEDCADGANVLLDLIERLANE